VALKSRLVTKDDCRRCGTLLEKHYCSHVLGSFDDVILAESDFSSPMTRCECILRMQQNGNDRFIALEVKGGGSIVHAIKQLRSCVKAAFTTHNIKIDMAVLCIKSIDNKCYNTLSGIPEDVKKKLIINLVAGLYGESPKRLWRTRKEPIISIQGCCRPIIRRFKENKEVLEEASLQVVIDTVSKHIIRTPLCLILCTVCKRLDKCFYMESSV